MTKQLLLILFFSLSFCLFSQDSEYRNYNISHGLPSSETYDIYQDSLGFIWITTDRGLSRFDGRNFKNYDRSNGLPNDVVFDFYEESKTKVWFSTKEKEMYYFNPTAYPIQFYPFHLNKQLKSIHDKYQLIGHIKKFKKTDDHYDIRFHGTNGYLELYDSTHIKAVEINRFVGSNKYKTVELTIDSIRVYSKISIGILTTVINDQTHQRKQIFEISTSSYLTEDMYNIDKVIRTNDNIEILNGNNLFIVCADSIRLIPLEYVGLDMDHMPTNNHLFVATYNGFYQLDQQYNLIKKGLQNYTVSSVLIDKNNGLWFSTIESGIFYLKNYNINTLKFKDKQIPSNAVLFKNNLTLISSGKYQLFIYNKKLEQLHIVKDAIYTKRASIIVSADKKNLNYFKMDNHFSHGLNRAIF